MKTKEFKYKVVEMGYTVSEAKKNKGPKHHKLLVSHSAYEHPVGWVFVNRPNSMRLLDGDADLFKVMAEYAATPLEEREDEKLFIYRLPVDSTQGERGYLLKQTDYKMVIDYSLKYFVLENRMYQFSEEEVGRYSKIYHGLFDTCIKEEVQ